MSKVTLKEFSSLLNIPYDTVKKNAQRGKIIKGTNDLIDTEDPINKLFFESKKLKEGTKPIIQKEVIEKKLVEKINTQTKEQKIYRDLDLRTKTAIVELKEREAEVKRIQLEKSAGNLLPVDIVEKVLVINFQSIFKNLDLQIENKCSIWGENLKATREQIIDMIKEERLFLSKSIEKAKKDALHEIENFIKEHQDKK